MGWISTILEIAVWPATFMGLLAAIAGERSGQVLLVGFMCAVLMEWSGVPFDPLVWAALDVLMCLVLIRKGMSTRHIVIVALFVPMWIAYVTPEPYPHWVTCFGVIIQFLIATTEPSVLRCWRTAELPPIRSPFDFRIKGRPQ